MNLIAKDASPSREEVYQALVRSLRRRKGFGIVFVQCSPAEATRLIEEIQTDLPQKQFANLKFDAPIDNLYDIVAELPNRENLNILFIEGLEKSLEPYIKPGYGGDGDYYKLNTVPTILSHLNQRRELFRDHFHNICFIFFLPLFAIKYIIRRSPDFYDWSAGVFDFITETDIQKENLVQYKRIGVEYHKQKQYEQAIEVYQQALLVSRELGNRRDESEALGELGQEYFRLKEYEKSIKLFEQCLVITQEIDDYEGQNTTLNFLANAYLRIGKSQEAINFLQQQLTITSEIDDYQNNYYILKNLAVVYSNLGEYKKEINYLQQALMIYKERNDYQKNGDVLGKLGRAYANLGDYKKAITYYNKALETGANEYWIWLNKAKVLSRMGRTKEAISSYEKVLEIKPDYSTAHHNRALALAGIGRYEESVQGFRKAIKLKPDNEISWICLGGSLRSLRLYEESLACYDKAAELRSEWGASELSGRIISLLRLGRFKEAFINGYKYLLVFKAERGVREWVERRVAITLTRLGLQKLVPIWTKFLQLIGWRVKY